MKVEVTDSRGPHPSAPPPSRTVSSSADDGRPTGLFRSAPFGRAMGTYLPATVAFRLINYGRIVLLTYWMTTQQFGLLSIILLWINVLIPLCSLGLGEAVTRYVPQYETRGALLAFLRRSSRLVIMVTAASVGMMILFSPTLGELFYAQAFADPLIREQFSADAPQLAQLSAAVIGLCIIYFYLLAVMKGLRMFAALAVMEIAHGVLFLVGAGAAIMTGHLSAFTLTMMYGVSLIGPIAFFAVGLLRVMRRWKAQHAQLGGRGNGSGSAVSPVVSGTGVSPVVNGEGLARKLLRFSIWTTLAGSMWQLLVCYPALFLNKVHGHEAVAVFNAARQIGQFVLIGAVAVATVVMTTVTKTWESRGKQAAERQLSLAFRSAGLGLLTLCAVVALAKDLIILRIYPADFAPGASILPLQLLFFLIAAYLAFLPIHFQLIEKTRHIFWPWAVGVAANVLVALWLVGPNLESTRDLAIWQSLAPIASAIFSTGFSDPQGLGGASWCGVIAITLALTMCVVLVRAERCRLDRGSYIVILSAGLLATNVWILMPGMVILLLLSWRTELIFTTEERRELDGHITRAWQHIPGIGSLWRSQNGSR